MALPSQTIPTEGTELWLARLPVNVRDILPVTVTAGAAGAGDETISLTASTPFYLMERELLDFGGTIVIPAESKVIGTTATPVVTEPIEEAVSASATAEVKPLFLLLGMTEASPNFQTQTIDTTNFLSGFGREQEVVGVDRNFSVAGNMIIGDICLDTVVMPFITDDSKVRGEVYARLKFASGEQFEGAAKIANVSGQGQLRNIRRYQFELNFQGKAFKWQAATDYSTILAAIQPVTP